MLPTDAAQTINSWIESHATAATNELRNNADSSHPKTDDDQPIAVPSTPAPKKADSNSGSNGGSSVDKQKLDALINKNAPFAPAPRQ
jgi:hypothetical protein